MRFSLLFGYQGDDGPRDRLFGWVLKWWRANFPEAQVCMGRNFDQPFHRGKARNDAARYAAEDILVVADADTIPHPDAVLAGIGDVNSHRAAWVLPYGEEKYFNLSERATEFVLACDPSTTQVPLPENPDAIEHQVTSWAGCVIVPRVTFEAVGGYDERFVGWGYEDNAFQCALDTIAGPHHRLERAWCSHLWHPVREVETWSQPFIGQNRELYDRYRRAVGRPDRMRRVMER